MPKQEKIIIIDGNALVHRAFHALPPTMQTTSGQMTNAVYGFITILFKVLKELKPQYAVVTFDLAKKTFRHAEYSAYKAQRKKQPDELYAQIPIVKEIVRAFNIPIYEQEGYEADDLIGTLTKKLDGKLEKYIITGDMDALQLVDEHTKVFTLKKGVKDTIIYDIAGVQERFSGLLPNQMIDYKALRGDASDNIPGVKGIGEKGAIELLKKFKDLENIYANLPKIKGAIKDKLSADKDNAFLSKRLATIIRDIPIKLELKDCLLSDYDRDQVYQVLQKYEFKSLLNQFQNIPQFKAQQSLFGEQSVVKTREIMPHQNEAYRLIDTAEKLENFIKVLSKQKIIALDTETDSLNFISNKLVGLSISFKTGEAYFILAKLAAELKDILEDSEIKKIGHNIKFDLHALHNAGIQLAGICGDTMLAAYLLNPGTRQHSLDKLTFAELGHTMFTYEELCGKGKEQKPLSAVPLEQLTYYAAEDADYTWQLAEKLLPELKQKKLFELYKTLEVPLILALADMERIGVLIDENFLQEMQISLTQKLQKLEQKIYQLAGEEFNIASPKQLKEILFVKLKIGTQNIKKIKTGLSTAAAELEKMRGDHEIIDLISDHREYSKLQSTYVEALPKLINPKTGRVHTSFNQTITATGRLSSSDPNLQNIPVRTELGREIRRAFIAPPGCKLVSIDYSQIELRVMAHLSKDQKMLAAFKASEDIHRRTAAEIWGVSMDQVTPEMRRNAKSINFGVLYGMGVYGLAQDAGISREEARVFIDKYFALYQDVARYVAELKDLAQEQGYVSTLFGRIRYLPDIHSGIFSVRAAAERMAINMPVQGTAADLMKMALLKVHAEIQAGKIKAKMLLQVHDELVFEIAEKNAEKEAEKIKKIMENIYTLDCPLKAEIKIGNNWGELK